MKLHGMRPSAPKGRPTMVRRVVELDWSLTEAADRTAPSATGRPDSGSPS